MDEPATTRQDALLGVTVSDDDEIHVDPKLAQPAVGVQPTREPEPSGTEA